MFTQRMMPDRDVMAAIEDAATEFESNVQDAVATYRANAARFPMTERRVEAPILAAFGG